MDDALKIVGNGTHLRTKERINTVRETEQRFEKRHTLRNREKICFYNNGVLFQSGMVNLSTQGACLQFFPDDSEPRPYLYAGKRMECYILTRNGRSKFRGTVRWVCKKTDYLLWGVSFMERSSHKTDPLQMLIDNSRHNGFFLPLTSGALY